MKTYHAFLPCLPVAAALAILSGCTENLSGPSSASNDPASLSVLSRGIVSTDTGLAINGERLPVQSAAVSIDGQSSSTDSLKDGMWVTVERQNGEIRSISYDEDVKGPIDIVERDGSLSVMGQRVLVSSSTYFDDSRPGTLNTGDVIEVSGLRDSNDNLAASRIELKRSPTQSWSVRGTIRNIDQSLQIFTIGSLTVDYSQARFDDIRESSLTNGLQVEAKDESRTYEPGSLYLLATKIENDGLDVHDSDTISSSSLGDDSNTQTGESESSGNDDSSSRIEVEIDGIVTDFDPVAATLEVEGIEISTSSTTEYQDDDDHYVTREAFFASLRQGITVVKVKWRPFTGYDQPPRELEIES